MDSTKVLGYIERSVADIARKSECKQDEVREVMRWYLKSFSDELESRPK